MEKTLNELAELIGGKVLGDGNIKIFGLAGLDTASETDLSFAVVPYIEAAKNSHAAAIIISSEFAENFPNNLIIHDEPKVAFAKLVDMFAPKVEFEKGISEKSFVGKNAKISPDAVIMPFACIDDNAEIKSGAIIYPHTYIGKNSVVGEDSIIYSSVTIRENCKVGSRCVIHSSTVIGADGFGFTTENGIHTKVPQVGNVIIEDDVEIGAHVGIDRAAMGSTVIGHGTKIDNLVHIGHNCKIGANCLIVAQTGISGSTVVGDNVTFGGQVGTVGHITIGGNSIYAARSGIMHNMPEGFFGAGFPVQPHTDWLKMQASLKKIPELIKKINQLEKELNK